MSEPHPTPDWKQHGVRVVKAGELDTNTPQMPGMNRAAIHRAARDAWRGIMSAGGARADVD